MMTNLVINPLGLTSRLGSKKPPIQRDPLSVGFVINDTILNLKNTPSQRFYPVSHRAWWKKVLGIGGAIIGAFFAPVIAASIGLSGAIGAATTATIGNVVGSAIVGAGLGAINAKVFGADVRRGALMGGIGGGLTGYFHAPATASPAATGGISEGYSSYTPPTVAGMQPTNAGLSYAPQAQAVESGYFGGPMAEAAAQGVTGESTFISALKDRITDPEALANVTLQAGGMVAAGVLSPIPGLSPEEQALVEQRAQELARMKQRDEASYQREMDTARMYLQQAKQNDPVYAAQQSAAAAKIKDARLMREQERSAGLTKEGHRGRSISPAERHRMALASSRDVSSAYATGYQQGQARQDAALARLSGIPRASDSYYEALQTTQAQKAGERATQIAQAQKQRDSMTKLFGGFAIPDRGDIDKKKRTAGLTGGASIA